VEHSVDRAGRRRDRKFKPPVFGQIQAAGDKRNYVPLPARRQEIPKDGGKVRVLSIPAIRDPAVQGALKLILERLTSLQARLTPRLTPLCARLTPRLTPLCASE
jgi:retron-type reverse transcriptase